MKTKFKRFSKRTLSLVLAALMMFSTIIVGSFTANAEITNIGYVYLIGYFNNWQTSDANYKFTPVNGDYNHYTGSFYVPYGATTSDNKFKLYMGNTDWGSGNQYYSFNGHTFSGATSEHAANMTNEANSPDDLLECVATNSGYIKLDLEFWGSYGVGSTNYSKLIVNQTAVAPLSATAATGEITLTSGGTAEISNATVTGGSGSYNHSLTVTDSSNTDVTAQVLSGTTFTAPAVTSATTYTITDTVTDSHTLLSGLASATATTKVTVNPVATETKYYYRGTASATQWSAVEMTPGTDSNGVECVYYESNAASNTFKISDSTADMDWSVLADASYETDGTTFKYITAPAADSGITMTNGNTDSDKNNNILLTYSGADKYRIIYYPSTNKVTAEPVTVEPTPVEPTTEAPTYSNEHVYTKPTVTLNTNLTSVKAGETVTLTAEITNKLYDTYQGKISEYNGRLVYNFYKMTGTTPDTTKDTLVRTRTGTYTSTGANTATVTDFTVYEDSTLYVVAYPSPDRTASGMSDTVTIKNTTKSDSAAVTVYVDFGAATVTGTPSITTVTSAGATKDYDLTLVGGNIYRAVNVTASYFVDGEGTAATYTSDFNVKYITVNGQTVYLSEAHQPDINALLESKIVWYKSTVTDFTNNLSSTSFEINETDEISKHADLSSEVVEQDMNVEADFVYTTKRLYITDNLPWNNLYIYYSSAETDKFSAGGKMTEAGLNRYSQTYYYYDLPADADQFYVTNAETSPTKTSETVTLSAVFSRTSENAYYFTGDNTLGLWTDNDYPQTPGIEKSYSDIYISVGDTLNITPSAYEANLSLDYAVTEGADRITITKSDDYAATLSAVAVGTGTGAGTATFTITPHGYLQEYEDQNTHEIKKAGNAYGVPVEITVHIVDKTDLNMLIANGATAIANKATGKAEYDYNEVMYSNFVSAQARAKSLYCTSYDQAVIDAAAANLRNALNALYVLDSTNMTEEFNLLSYNSSTVKFNKNGNGAIGAPTSAESNCIITTEADGSYTVFYAYGTAGYVVNGITLYTGLDVNCLADDSGAGSDPFENWTSKIGTATTADVASTAKGITLTAPAGVSTYTANFTAMVRAKLKYNFEDFDPEKAGQYEYKENCTKAASYTTADFSMPAADLTNSSNLMNYAELKAPNIVSNYFNYSLAPVANQDFNYNNTEADGTSAKPYVIEVQMTNAPVVYTITLPGAKTMSCHYNELVTLSASDYGIAEGTDVYWYIADQKAGTEQVLSTSFEYQFRATHNISLSVDANTSGKTVASGSTVTASYTKFFPNDNNQECVGQCFYIQNFIPKEEKENFVGAGIFYFMYNDTTKKPSLSAITDTVISNDNMSSYATEIAQNTALTYNGSVTRGQHSSKLNYVYVDYAKDKAQSGTAQKLRYSTVEESFNLIYEISAVSNPSRANYSYHVYSFYVYKDSNGDYWAKVSTSYAEAKYYVAQTA